MWDFILFKNTSVKEKKNRNQREHAPGLIQGTDFPVSNDAYC